MTPRGWPNRVEMPETRPLSWPEVREASSASENTENGGNDRDAEKQNLRDPKNSDWAASRPFEGTVWTWLHPSAPHFPYSSCPLLLNQFQPQAGYPQQLRPSLAIGRGADATR